MFRSLVIISLLLFGFGKGVLANNQTTFLEWSRCVSLLSEPRQTISLETSEGQYSEQLLESQVYRFLKSSGNQSLEISGWIKFVVVRGKIFYFNSNKWLYHTDFVREVFSEFSELEQSEIDKIALSINDDRLVYGSLSYLSEDLTAKNALLQILSDTSANPGYIQKYRDLVKSTAPQDFLQLLRYFPTTQQKEYVQENLSQFTHLNIPVYFSKEVAGDQIYNSQWSVGKLVKLNQSELDQAIHNGEITGKEILLMDELPRELPPVRGVIVNQPSTPLSHVALMATTYGYPFAYVKGAFEREDLLNLVGKNVYYSTLNKFKPVSVFEISDELFSTLSPYKEIDRSHFEDVAVDFSVKEFTDVSVLSENGASQFGSKSTNFASLQSFFNYQRHKQAFKIPLGFVRDFLKTTEVASSITAFNYITEKLETIKNDDIPLNKVQIVLKDIRNTIKGLKFPEDVLQELKKRLDERFPGQAVRFRSSSPFEDTKAFNGAGLYDSKGIKSDHSIEEINKDLLSVIASLYNDRAFNARKAFGYVEQVGSMGVLVHASYKGELARGVAIFSSEKGENFTGVPTKEFKSDVSGFKGDRLKVVDAPLGVRPETAHIETFFGQMNVSRTQLTSELPNGRFVLSKDQYLKLFETMKSFFINHYGHNAVGIKVDYEWKLVQGANGPEFEIKQFRPVPGNNRFIVPDEDIFVFDQNMYLEASHFEKGDAIYEFNNNIGIKINGEVLEFSKEKAPQLFSIELTHIDGNKYTISGDNIEYEFLENGHSTSWVAKLPDPLSENRIIVTFSDLLKHDVGVYPISDLVISLKRDEDSWNSSRLTTDKHSINLGSGKKDQLKEDSFFFQLNNNRVEIKTKGYTRVAGFDKTMHLRMDSMKITGLPTVGDVTFTGPDDLIYSPAHHNFYWEYGVNLSRVFSEEQKQSFLQEFGVSETEAQFLLVTSARPSEVDGSNDARNKIYLRFYDSTGKTELKRMLINKE